MSAAAPSAAMSGPAPVPATTGSSALVPVGDAPGHLVSKAPFDPQSAVRLTVEQEHFYLASQWMLMWWKFKRHKVAVASAVILMIMYGSTLVTEFLCRTTCIPATPISSTRRRSPCTGCTRASSWAPSPIR
jgi:hypothetical protein